MEKQTTVFYAHLDKRIEEYYSSLKIKMEKEIKNIYIYLDEEIKKYRLDEKVLSNEEIQKFYSKIDARIKEKLYEDEGDEGDEGDENGKDEENENGKNRKSENDKNEENRNEENRNEKKENEKNGKSKEGGKNEEDEELDKYKLKDDGKGGYGPISEKTLKAYKNTHEKDVEKPRLIPDKIPNFNDIMDSFDSGNSEIKEVRRIGKKIAHKMRTIKWMTWTLFPFEFENCRIDTDLYQAIDNFNAWMTDIGILTDEDEDEFEDEFKS